MIEHVISVNSINNTQSIMLSKSLDITTFYNSIKQNKANIRSAQCRIFLFFYFRKKKIFSFLAMRNLITKLFPSPITSPIQSNLIKTQTLILPKPTSSLSYSNSQREMTLFELKKFNEHNRRLRRRSLQTNRYDKYTRTYFDNHEIKQQAHCTPIIELKPIMGGSSITTQNIHSFTRENQETIVVRDSQNNEIKKVTTIISKNTELNEQPHVSSKNIFSRHFLLSNIF